MLLICSRCMLIILLFLMLLCYVVNIVDFVFQLLLSLQSFVVAIDIYSFFQQNCCYCGYNCTIIFFKKLLSEHFFILLIVVVGSSKWDSAVISNPIQYIFMLKENHLNSGAATSLKLPFSFPIKSSSSRPVLQSTKPEIRKDG